MNLNHQIEKLYEHLNYGFLDSIHDFPDSCLFTLENLLTEPQFYILSLWLYNEHGLTDPTETTKRISNYNRYLYLKLITSRR